MIKSIISKSRCIILLALLIVTSSCDSFLDTEPSNEVSHTDIFRTTDLVQTILDGMYRYLREHDNINLKSFDLRLDVIDGRDIMMNTSGFFNGDYNLGIDKTTQDIGEVANLWNFYYQLINHANNILFYIDDAEGSDSEKNRIKGESLTFRAFSYYNLINHFQHAWIKGKDLPGVPIYLKPTSNKTVGNPRATVEKVYIQIISDLEEAIIMLSAEESILNKGYINKNVANGILARTYLFQGEYQKAAQHAKEARKGYPLMTQNQYVSGFNDSSNPEWIWGLPFGEEEILFTSSLFSDYDLERPNSNWSIRINNHFYDLFSNTDCRAKLSVNGNAPLIIYKNQPPVSLPVNEADLKDSLITRKFRDNANFTGHYLLMRSSEMILIEAEAEAELNNNEIAQNLLFEIQKRADEVATKTTAIGQLLINEILLERRKELFGEGLASVLDLKRRNLPLYRVGNQIPGGFEAGSNRLVWQIPIKEIDANINISESEQNPI